MLLLVASSDYGKNFRPPETAITQRESGSTVLLCQLRFLPKTVRLELRHMLARACSSPAATGCQTAGHTWWPQSHVAVLWTPGIPSTGHRFPGEECSNPPAPDTAPGSGVGGGTGPQTAPNPRRFRGRPWHSRIRAGRRIAARAWVVPLGGLRKN